jgi:F0F1-type ATP synthase membrane subunit b/b'
LLVGAILKYAVWIALAVGIVVLAVALWKFTGWLDRRLDARDARRARVRDELAAIARRAEEQNAQVLAGDDRGVYGDYRPTWV